RHHFQDRRGWWLDEILRAASRFWRLDRAFSRGVQPVKDDRCRVRRSFLRRAVRRWNISHLAKGRGEVDTTSSERRHILLLGVLTTAKRRGTSVDVSRR